MILSNRIDGGLLTIRDPAIQTLARQLAAELGLAIVNSTGVVTVCCQSSENAAAFEQLIEERVS